ncbi:MAG: hypothetical protein QOE82_2563 [Thermoanaerobaculia bacterium]|jgi:hypothetical protein|nr:hypothetical protein [Thermoanaerobaculia bacterium]
MALEGTHKDFSLADIFQLIGLQRKTGVLTLRAKDDTVTVTFLDGKVVGADSLSHRLENRLGHVLIRSELLTQDQLNRALEIQKETLQRLGFILVHYGIISVESLKQALQLQILQIVFRLFRWKDGDYHFSQETTIEYDRDYVVPVSAESILMEGARMIDEWPIIEKRIRSYDMVFRKKLTDQEIVVVGAEEADEIDFDSSDPAPARRRRQIISDKIRISREEKVIYDMVDGTMSVRDVMEMSKFSEFDTAKSLYELLTRDLIEEVRGSAAAEVLAQTTPVDETDVAETPVPLPLVAVLALLAILSLATSFRNPLNSLHPLGEASRSSSVNEMRKAISIERIQQIGEAVEVYNLVNGHLPSRLQDLTPIYISPSLLHDPWGHAYKYLPQPQRYLVIGFTPDEKPDTDLFLSHMIESGSPSAAASKPVTGGIQLLD